MIIPLFFFHLLLFLLRKQFNETWIIWFESHANLLKNSIFVYSCTLKVLIWILFCFVIAMYGPNREGTRPVTKNGAVHPAVSPNECHPIALSREIEPPIRFAISMGMPPDYCKTPKSAANPAYHSHANAAQLPWDSRVQPSRPVIPKWASPTWNEHFSVKSHTLHTLQITLNFQ